MKVGSVGRPLPGTHVRIADDGENCCSGAGRSSGLLEQRGGRRGPRRRRAGSTPATSGEIDDEGFVRITGRKKEILVTAGGKNVAPASPGGPPARPSAGVSQCLVVGDGKPFIAALVTLDADTWPPGPSEQRAAAEPADAALHEPAVLAEIQKGVDAANEAVSKAESIRKFRILAATGPRNAATHPQPQAQTKRRAA
jgi:long-chain acyl-CoA synthetase